jgi:DNA-binding response OmpR family regulator
MPDTPTISRGRGTPPPRVVVADDSLEMCGLVALMLRSRGFDVVAAPDGDAALAAILSDGADGLVSDFQMPGLDGLTLCRVLRSLRASAALPIVIFTGVEDADPRLLPLRDLDEVRILHKPMGLREIAPALIEMMPVTVTGFPMGMPAQATPRPAASGLRWRT